MTTERPTARERFERLDDPIEHLAERQASRWFKPGQSSNVIVRLAWKVVIFVVGSTVVVAGIAMLVLPGPGIITIIAGLAILATEFVWAKYLLRRAKEYAAKAKDKAVEANNRRKRRR
jgi:uncharacterized protein (TIGR02611 family)